MTFKRMSILSRRPGDDRAYFARKWRAHGELIVRLPGVRGYIQNHVLDEIDPGRLPVDGIVELWFDSPQAMADAFTGEAARAMADDEPSFLGRATGYVVEGSGGSLSGWSGVNKLIAVEPAPASTNHSVLEFAHASDQRSFSVTGIVPKLGQVEPPTHVTRFTEAVFPDLKHLELSFSECANKKQEGWAVFKVDSHRML